MNNKYYLPYYVGQKVRYKGMANDRTLTMHWLGDLLKKDGVIKNITLILRSLDRMTEQEAVHIARLAYGEEGPGMQYDKVFSQEDEQIVVQFSEGNYIMIYTNEFKIENRDDIKPDVSYCHYDVCNMPDIIVYLLSRGFDLFKLIEQGEAIEQDTNW